MHTKIAFGLTVSLLFLASNAAHAGLKPPKSPSAAFGSLHPTSRLWVEDAWKKAPEESRSLVYTGFRSHSNQDWFQISLNGNYASTFRPRSPGDANNGTVQTIHKHEGGQLVKSEFEVIGFSPVRLESEALLGGNVTRSGGTLPLGPKKDQFGLRSEDAVPVTAVSRTHEITGHQMRRVNEYAAMKVDDRPMRFTLGAELGVAPTSSTKLKKLDVDGKPVTIEANSLYLRGSAIRASPTSPIREIDVRFTPRNSVGSHAAIFKLPDDKKGQVLDFRFIDNTALNHQRIEVITTEGEHMVYALVPGEGRAIEFKPLSVSRMESLSSYAARVHVLKGRADGTQQVPRGMHVTTGAH